ncbi:MAG: cysteine synthase A [Bacteroidales bacterium]
MAKIAKSLLDLVGNTPLVQAMAIERIYNLKAQVLFKLEYFNPLGSVKDRIALAMINAAEKNGTLKKGYIIIEPTSGNTGIGLAFVAAIKGYQIILTMPDSMSLERRNLLQALGANLVLTPAVEGMKGAIKKAEELHTQNPQSIILQQFSNAANPLTHYSTTAEEIWRDTDGKIDIFVAGVGTGGTVSGVGKRLKEYNKNIQIVAVEPAESPVLSGGKPAPHKIQGIGAGFVPQNYDAKVVDLVMQVNAVDAINTSRMLATNEALLVGLSSGAAAYATIQLAKDVKNQSCTIVTVLPDTGERYLSTSLYQS